MSHTSAQAVKSLLKPYVRRILLKTHPDYFSRDAKKKKINQASFQSLQNVLNPILQEKHVEPDSGGSENSVKLEFFVRNIGNRKLSKVEHLLPISLPTSALDMWTTTTSIFDLCRKIGIQVMPSDVDAAQNMIDILSEQRSASSYSRKPMPSLTQIFADELYQSPIARHVTSIDKSDSKMGLENNELLYFQPHMGIKTKETMKKKLELALPNLQPSRWWRKVPLLCVEDENEVCDIDVSGILVFTAKMTAQGKCFTSSCVLFGLILIDIEDMQKYLKENLATKEKEYQQDLRIHSSTKA